MIGVGYCKRELHLPLRRSVLRSRYRDEFPTAVFEPQEVPLCVVFRRLGIDSPLAA
jgi:hypothetical protein